MTPRVIENDQLSLDGIPGPTAGWNDIEPFALTYNGYKKWGFDQCAKIAREKRHASLDDLRTCLFFEQRRWNHFGDHPDEATMDYVHTILSKIRAMVQSGPS